ncbi:MAG TPA: sensory rhodopsin transducer [Candidatus Acidoferrales bacterium]|nr:sensory rhodopsin transducer [Candidatus Acidoferrales bacterium]
MAKTANPSRNSDLRATNGAKLRPLGRKRWAIAEGYIPEESTGPEPEMLSHETACVLNANDREAHLRIMIYFSDREPVGPYLLSVGPRRTKHLRFNNLNDPAPIPRGKDYSSVIESDVPIVVQHTRLDSRQSANALLSTIAFAAD